MDGVVLVGWKFRKSQRILISTISVLCMSKIFFIEYDDVLEMWTL